MRRWLVVMAMLAACAAFGRDARAQAGMGTPRDTARAGIRYVYLIRHGFYDINDPRDERVGKALDSLGRAQAALTGERLARLPVRIDQLVSSTFTRARETADIIGVALKKTPVRDSSLSECTPPSYRADLKEDFPGEHDSCREQIERAWARYVIPAGGRDDRHDVLVCHGNVIRWIVSRALRADMAHWVDMSIGNGSITALQVRPDGSVRLAAFSDTGHLPPSLQTWTGTGAGWSLPPRLTSLPVQHVEHPAPGTPKGVHTRGRGVAAPAPEAAYDTLRHERDKGHK